MKIEAEIVDLRHCATFERGRSRCDLARLGREWEVKMCKVRLDDQPIEDDRG